MVGEGLRPLSTPPVTSTGSRKGWGSEMTTIKYFDKDSESFDEVEVFDLYAPTVIFHLQQTGNKVVEVHA
jgi:hypothetical protein